MIPFDQVEDYIGHAASGVCPFAVKPGVKVYLDEYLKRHAEVYPAAGSGKILRLHGLGGRDQDKKNREKRNKKREPAGSRSL